MKKYFFQTKFESFIRQLHVYGFKKIGVRFVDSGAYWNELFIRGRLGLCSRMKRSRKKSTFSSYVPNFYKMADITPLDDSCDDDDGIKDIKHLNEPKKVQYVIVNNE